MGTVHPPVDVTTLFATLFTRGVQGPCPLLEALTCLSQSDGIFLAFVF
jgi:hypothetical protein